MLAIRVRMVKLLGCVAVALLLPTAGAQAITGNSTLDGAETVASVTTGAAVRARVEVQIRSIKTMILTKAGNEESGYQQLEKLQKDLRGER